jgi:hypothetical protein
VQHKTFFIYKTTSALIDQLISLLQNFFDNYRHIVKISESLYLLMWLESYNYIHTLLVQSVITESPNRTSASINANPHGFKDITKLTAQGWKVPLLYHTPCTLHCGWSPVGGAFYAALQICLLKTWIILVLSSKALWKRRFLWTPPPPKQKSFWDILI